MDTLIILLTIYIIRSNMIPIITVVNCYLDKLTIITLNVSVKKETNHEPDTLT